MRNDPTQAALPDGNTSGLETCDYCKKYTPFTAAIAAGKPLGVVCTCVIEQRAIERFARKLIGHGPARVEGH